MTNIKIKYQIDPSASASEIFDVLLKSRALDTTPPALTLDSILTQSSLSHDTLVQAKEVIDQHLSAGNDICVFGDYDADGVSATAVMWQALLAYGKQKGSRSRLLPFIPDRHRHGYGLGELAVSEVSSGVAFANTSYSDFSPKLIVTVDTGIVAHIGINYFAKNNIDVVITDHHLPSESDVALPPARAIIHTPATSGAGIAWIFALYLLGDQLAYNLLDLATIGIVGDMMRVKGLNRSLIKHGLALLSKTQRPGLLALKNAMGIKDKVITTHDISFGIAPRINAAGRIYNPTDALRLLCTSDSSQANALATKIEAHNKDRQEYTDQALSHALGSINPEHKIIAIIGDYHEGVIGLVAGKLVEKYAKPAIVMSNNGEVVKGSARSIPGVNITEILRSLDTPFLGLGGHDQAAGFSLSHELVNNFIDELNIVAGDKIDSSLLVKHETVDFALSLSQATLELAKLIPSLEPFGLGNQKPKFLFTNLSVLEDRELGTTGKHYKLTVQSDNHSREVLIFNSAYQHPIKHIQNLICTLDVNVWKNKESLQLLASYVEI